MSALSILIAMESHADWFFVFLCDYFSLFHSRRQERTDAIQKQLHAQLDAVAAKNVTIHTVMEEVATLAEVTPATPDDLNLAVAKLYHKYVKLGMIKPDKTSLKKIPQVDDDDQSRVSTYCDDFIRFDCLRVLL